MTRGTFAILAGALAAGAASILSAQSAPDLVLSNGKIITVDERFTIAQAVAIRGDQIVAVGTSQDRDYLMVPANEIKDIRPVQTLVGGRVVYDAASATSSSR